MNFLKRKYWILISALAVILDQISKYIVDALIPIHDSIVVIPDFFSLTHVRNTGAAFGIFAGQRWVFMIFTVAIILVAVYFLQKGKIKNPWGIVSLALVIGGGIGNMIDRLFLGEVIDFFAFNFWGYQFAVFNVADIFVCCGTFMLAFYIFFTHDFDVKRTQDEALTDE